MGLERLIETWPEMPVFPGVEPIEIGFELPEDEEEAEYAFDHGEPELPGYMWRVMHLDEFPGEPTRTIPVESMALVSGYWARLWDL